MATVASPVPSASYAKYQTENHRLSQRLPVRPTSMRSYQTRRSPQGAISKNTLAKSTVNDSSDDEDLAPIKLSAEAQAILGVENAKQGLDQENMPPENGQNMGDDEAVSRYNRRSLLGSRNSPLADNGSPAPRSMRIAGARPSPPRTLARDGSFMYKINEKSTMKTTLPESRTPAQPVRRVRVSGSRGQTRSPPSLSKSRSSEQSEQNLGDSQKRDEGAGDTGKDDDYVLVHPSTIPRQRRGEEAGSHSTMRVRRIGTGTLLNGPIRRGMIRRHNEEGDDGLVEPVEREDTPEVEQSRRAKEPDLEDLPDQVPMSYGSPKHSPSAAQGVEALDKNNKHRSPQEENISEKHQSPVQQPFFSTSLSRPHPTPASNPSRLSSRSSGSNRRPIFQIPPLPPLESAHDQENEPPPTFRRPKATAPPLLEVQADQRPASPKALTGSSAPQQKDQALTASPSRPPLTARSNNTPHRPAPAPPPKMSLVDAATSAGANSRSKKSVHYVLNGRTYRRLDAIGRGGSSRVFRIMAENYKIFALKRVNLDEADMAAIAGYKGEIDLLKKLENVDRVIRLFDYEVNEEKGVLSVMMELGESDFNKMLNEQLKGESARLDITFTRHYWKEMLECVKAVHDHGIVHSDLKPANFLLVKGQLKLIDFGIAGAIQDNTVNVHRENQIGTPNYMSPESLVCHTPAIGQATGTKLLKLGKPSDVWSLGCILYQMTYGQPPFAHITKQFERIMSIPNPKVEIQFPGVGVGGAVVPFGLVKTLRRCLQRDQSLRPTIEELLSDSDPFLNPVAISPDMLGRVIGNVVGYCRKREEKLKEEGRLRIDDGLSVLPKDDEMRGWPGAFYEKLREAGLEGTAW